MYEQRPNRNDSDGAELEERWDAHDPRRQEDCFAPPTEPCECYCLHCQRTFMSDQIWLQRIIGDKQMKGFWKCPTPNCGGAGFTFDIFPTDPDHPANACWACDDFDDDDLDDEENEIDPDQREYDPAEPKYKALEEEFGDCDDCDIQGEEWKYGLVPGEERPEPEWADKARREWEEEQKKYDEPDQRPRMLDWTAQQDVHGETRFREDDIPF